MAFLQRAHDKIPVAFEICQHCISLTSGPWMAVDGDRTSAVAVQMISDARLLEHPLDLCDRLCYAVT